MFLYMCVCVPTLKRIANLKMGRKIQPLNKIGTKPCFFAIFCYQKKINKKFRALSLGTSSVLYIGRNILTGMFISNSNSFIKLLFISTKKKEKSQNKYFWFIPSGKWYINLNTLKLYSS